MDHDPPSDPIARVRALLPAIAQASDTIERTRRIPAELLDSMHAARLFRLLLPRSVDGDEVPPWAFLAVGSRRAGLRPAAI